MIVRRALKRLCNFFFSLPDTGDGRERKNTSFAFILGLSTDVAFLKKALRVRGGEAFAFQLNRQRCQDDEGEIEMLVFGLAFVRQRKLLRLAKWSAFAQKSAAN